MEDWKLIQPFLGGIFLFPVCLIEWLWKLQILMKQEWSKNFYNSKFIEKTITRMRR